ncbi:MAG TPA: hypothetical protein VGR48_05125 [Terriglobales bacterium]|nr:hypothetical protein [Terriglobales bacterium]
MTVAIAAAAVVQAAFAALLWRLQSSIEYERKKTSVSVSFELRRPDPAKPQQAWLHIENASGTGIYLTRLTCTMKSKSGNRHGPVDIDLRMSIPPWGSREKEITATFLAEAMKTDSSDAATAGARTVDTIFRPHYIAEKTELAGRTSVYQIEFSGHNIQRAVLTNEAEGLIEFI